MKIHGTQIAEQKLLEKNMQFNSFKKAITLMSLTLFVCMSFKSTVGFAGGDNSGGGDESCEAKFKEIVSDIRKWVREDGPELNHLKLPESVSFEKHKARLLYWTDNGRIHISCNKDGTQYYHTDKTCQFSTVTLKKEKLGKVECDSLDFYRLSEDLQYRQVYHELLGLAQIEKPNKENPADSNYEISDQIMASLVNANVKKLAIKDMDSNRGENSTCDVNAAMKAITKIAAGLSRLTSPTIENSAAIINIAKSCKNSLVKKEAARLLSNGLSNLTQPSSDVAKKLSTLCGEDKDCAIEAINSLSNSISNSNYPTINALEAIVSIVKQAPYESVKSAAISALSECISDLTNPTQFCANAMSIIGSLNNLK